LQLFDLCDVLEYYVMDSFFCLNITIL
jgi:hypothetical protein